MIFINRKPKSYLLIPVMFMGLTACGGGSSNAVDPKQPDPDKKNTAPIASQVNIHFSSNGPWIGTQVNASYVYKDEDGDKEGPTTLRWLRDGNPIADATGNNYILHADDVNKSITVEVTPIALTGIQQGKPIESSAIQPSQNNPPVANSASLQVPNEGIFVGLNLDAVFRYNDVEEDAPGQHQYQWLRDGVAIEGANAKTYTMVAADAGKLINASITPVATAGQSPGQPAITRTVTPILNLAPIASNVSINLGWSNANADVKYTAPKYGVKINGQYDYHDEEGDTQGKSIYRWLRDGEIIEGETDLYYTVQATDKGKHLTFEVTPVASTGLLTGITKTSADTAKAVINFAPEARNVRLIFEGDKINVGEPVTLAYDFYDQDDDHEQGTSARILIDGATVITDSNGNFIATEAHIGSSLTAEVTPRSAHGELYGAKINSDPLRIHPRDRHFFTASIPWEFDSDRIVKVIGLTDGHSENKTSIIKVLDPNQTLIDFTMEKTDSLTQPISISNDPLVPRWLTSVRGFLATIQLSESGENYTLKYIEEDASSRIHRMVKNITPFKGKLFFSSLARHIGSSIWVTDGTVAGTQLFMDVKSHDPFALASNYTVFDGKLFFTASTSQLNDAGNDFTGYGNELWVSDGELKTDGTPNAQLLKDINPGIDDSTPNDLTEFNGALYFSARSANGEEYELWKTDGTTNGTIMVPGVSKPRNLKVVGDRLFFISDNQSVWMITKDDDTPTKVTDLSFPINNHVNINEFIAVGSNLYFTAKYELYKVASDSSSAVKILPTLATGAVNNIESLTVFNNQLYLTGYTIANRRELLKVNASNQIELAASGMNSIGPGPLTVLNGRLIFSASNNFYDTELWHSDGTTGGTKELKDLNKDGSSNPILQLEY